MRYSFALVALAAFVAADSSSSAPYTNPFTSYLTETNSVGVVTGQPAVNTDVNTNVVTSQPSVVTSQPAVATSPAGTPTNLPSFISSSKAAGGVVPLATGTGGSGKASNGTVSTGSLKASGSAASGSKSGSEASSTNSNVGGSGSTPTSTASSTGSSSSPKSGAGVLEPVLGLGLAGAAFALFL